MRLIGASLGDSVNATIRHQQRSIMSQFIVDNLSTAVVLLDDNLCVHYANPAAEQLLAVSRAGLIDRPIAPFFYHDADIAAILADALNSQQAYIQREAQLNTANMQPVGVDFTITPLTDELGNKQLLIELQCLDGLQRINKEDSHLMANQAARALVRGVAHEVKNPLGGIRGAAQLLARQLHDAELKEYTDIIISETDRLCQLVNRMLGPRELPHKQAVNIHQVLERARLILQAEKGDALSIECDYDPSLPELWADIDQLIQVMLNILRNAAQALLENPSAGPAKIIIRTRAQRWCTIAAKRYRLACLVEIEDNGPGVDKDLLGMLFYPMVTGRAQGTGLGLPIAQAIMRQHGGVIECESNPGHTVFQVLIPFVEHESAGKGYE